MPTSTLRYSRFINDSDDDSDFEEDPAPLSPPDRGYPPNYKKLTPVRTLPPKKRERRPANGLLYHRANAVSSPKVAPPQPNPDQLPHIIGLGSTRAAPTGTSIGSIGSPGSSGSIKGSPKGSSRGGRRLSWDSTTGLVRPRLKRQHSHPLKENQTWHAHPLIRPLMQLVPEAFLSFLFWSLLVQFWGDVYWYQLQVGGLHPTLLYLLYLLTPALALGLAPVRNALAAYPWSRALLVVGGLLGMAGQLGDSSLYRLTLAGSAVGVMGTLVFDGIWAGTAARRRRTGFGVAGGALLLQALTFAYGGRNPAAASLWTFLLVAALPGVLVVLVVLYEDAVGWAAREGGTNRLDEEHGEAGVEVFSDIAMDDVLSNDDWDDSEADAASLLQARLQSRGVTSTSGNGIDSPLPLKEGMRLLRVQSPPVRILGLETAGVARNGNSGGVPRPDQNGGGSGELLDGRGEHLGPKRPASAPLLGTDFGAAQDGNGRTSNQVEIEIEIVPAEPEVAVKHGTSAKGSRFVPGKRASEAQPGQSRPIAKAAQEIELCTVEEPLRSPDAKEKAFAKQHGSRKTARAHQGVSHAAGNEREGPDGASGLHPRNPHHLDLESGLSGESQGESADGEREAEPMLANGAEANETWQFLPKKAMDLGRRFGEGEEVPWPHGREETPFSDQDAEFEVFRERGRRWTKSGTLRTIQMGLSLGCLLFLTHWLLTAPTLPARWAGASPWWGLLSLLSLTAGIALAAEGAKVSKQLHGFGAGSVAAIGCLVMLLLGAPGAISGAVLLALAAPSLWVTLSRNTVNVYAGPGIALSATVYICLALWSAFLVAYGNVPGGLVVRGTALALMLVSLGGVALGLGRGPPLSSEDRRLLGAMLGAWKAGRPNWGSGVPGRKAVGALAALVGLLLVAAIVQRLLALPVTYHSAPGDSLRVLSFNVYQGYNRAGGNNFRAIQNVIRDQKPHFVMLQETDTMRIIQGNRDMMDYLSLGLRMYALATPPTRTNTWGCAMLSRFPFKSASWEVLPSEHGEAACFQHATVQIGTQTVHLMNTHFGEDERDRTVQAQAVADHIRGALQGQGEGILGQEQSVTNSSNPDSSARVSIVLAGDFNSAPLSPQYMEIVSAGVNDARAELYGQWKSPAERDRGAGLVFVSNALNCTKWVEPIYDQRKTADGNPVVVTFTRRGSE